MPATMMHLQAGHDLLPQGSDAYFLGCILPDCLDFDRERKDRLHLRDLPQEERLLALIRLGKSLNLKRDFDFGFFFHLYLDYLWDNGPQSAHRRSYSGDLWFRDYRIELKKAGARSARRMPWAKELWQRLAQTPLHVVTPDFQLPREEVEKFLSYNVSWHLQCEADESEIFTDQVVDSFCHRSAAAFSRFLTDFFPEEAKTCPLSTLS